MATDAKQSAHSSPESAGSTLDSSELDSRLSGNASKTSSATESSKSTGPMFSGSETSKNSANPHTWTSSSEDSPAKTSQSQEEVPASPESARVFGPSLPGLLAKWDHDTSSWRTYRRSENGDLKRSSKTSLRSGMTRNGTVYQLQPLAPLTRGTASGLLPTPAASPAGWKHIEVVDKDGNPPTHANQRWYHKETGRVVQKDLSHVIERNLWPTPRHSDGAKNVRTPEGAAKEMERKGPSGIDLSAAAQLSEREMFPTPLASNTKANHMRSGGREPRSYGASGQLNPTWVEWLMGFPLGWTDLAPSETPSSPKSQSGSLGGSVSTKEESE